MRINKPVTDNEIVFEDNQILVTKTNLEGIITYANRDFLRISGFDASELYGKSHNVIRHPDMPVEIYKDLWKNLKAGRPWCRVIKNRCKNGDYYWIRANITPVRKEGRIVEYMSVRSKPNSEQIANAKAFYEKVKRKEERLEPCVLKTV